jgi:localization factor PodJL
MKSGKSWGIRNIDDRTLEMAEAAARQAGMTLEAWLSQAVAERAGEEGIVAARDLHDEDAGGIAASLARLGEQVRAMTAEVRTTPGSGPDFDAAAMVERLAREMKDADETARTTVEGLGRAGAAPRGDARLEDAIRSLEAQIAAVAGRSRTGPRRDTAYDDVRDRMEALLARAPEPEPSRSAAADLEQTIRDLEARLARAGRTAPEAPRRDNDEDARIRRIKARLAEISNHLADLPPQPAPRKPREPDPLAAAIADIARRQSALSARSAMPPPPPRDVGSSASIAALRTEVVVLSDRIAALTDRSKEDRTGFDGLSGRIDRLAAAEQASAAAVVGALSDIRTALDGLASQRAAAVDPGAVASIAAGLAELRGKIEGLEKAGRADSESLRRLETRIEDIAEVDPAALIRNVEARIDGLAARIDAVIRAPVGTAALDEIRGEIGAVRAELAARDTKGLDALESRIRELAEQVAAAARPESDSDQLGALEARVEALAVDLVRSTPRAAALEQVEDNLLRLQASLVEGRKESIEAARAAARNAVRELGAAGADSDLVATLRNDLDEIRKLIGASGRPGEADDDAVKETLASVAERIGSIARDVEPPKPASSRPYVVTPAEPAIPRAEPRQRQDLAAIRELAGNVSPAKTPGRRADFIAAARRAAQAAVAEADAGTGNGVGDRVASGEAGYSPFARIGQAIRARRKPLLLAAAAIVLAIGALQLANRPVEVAVVAPPAPKTAAVIIHRPPAGASRAADTAWAPPFAIPEAGEAALVSPSTDARSAMALASTDAVVTGSTRAVAAASDVPGIGPEPLRSAAAAGDPAAIYEIGSRYAEGRGAPRDLAEAALWYKRAADAGLAPAQYRLGSLHERGQGVQRDPAQAVSLYRQAAELGNVGAMHNLAVLTSEGAAGAPDPKAAVRWFLAAADYGVKDSQYNLGVVYARGLGAATNLPEAYKWFAVAAAAGDKDAAARRDEVAALLDQNQLALARAAVKAWRPKAPPAAANTVAAPLGGWGDQATVVTADNQRALVMKIQTLLTEQGYDPGPADGVEGPKTRDAVRAFQARVGLVDTGLIDRSLVAALAGPTG